MNIFDILIYIFNIDILIFGKLIFHAKLPKMQTAETFIQAGESMDATKNKRIKKKKDAEEKASRNITYMVSCIGVLFFIGNAPNSIGFCLLQVQSIKTSTFISVYTLLANIMLFTSQGLDIFIYYKFNKKYKTIMMQLFSL